MGKQRGKRAMKIDTGVMIAERRVENPLRTWSQFMHELDSGTPDPGLVRVSVNLRTLMGGFCRFHGTEAQQKAAARFKALYERSQVGGAKAVDPSIEAVDGGGANPEANFEIGADARKAFMVAKDLLGAQDYRCAEFVVIGENGPTAYARFRLRTQRHPGARDIARYQVEFRRIMDRLAEHWCYQSRAH